jgi:hypothetical protein
MYLVVYGVAIFLIVGPGRVLKWNYLLVLTSGALGKGKMCPLPFYKESFVVHLGVIFDLIKIQVLLIDHLVVPQSVCVCAHMYVCVCVCIYGCM